MKSLTDDLHSLRLGSTREDNAELRALMSKAFKRKKPETETERRRRLARLLYRMREAER